jgi:TNF receptor-associated factor 2/TNF receptor-associated factor 3
MIRMHFYSSPTGYKMCLRLYLHGNDNARNTHVSLDFILMRGEFDAILHYPFCFKLIFCLYNQTDQ